MGGPSGDLASAIAELADTRGVPVNVYEAPPVSLVAPGVSIAPDDPWMVAATDDQPFGRIAENYVAVAVAATGDPESAKDQIRDLVRLIRDAADQPGMRRWAWTSTSGIRPAEDSGTIYLAATVKLTYSADD